MYTVNTQNICWINECLGNGLLISCLWYDDNDNENRDLNIYCVKYGILYIYITFLPQQLYSLRFKGNVTVLWLRNVEYLSQGIIISGRVWDLDNGLGGFDVYAFAIAVSRWVIV